MNTQKKAALKKEKRKLITLDEIREIEYYFSYLKIKTYLDKNQSFYRMQVKLKKPTDSVLLEYYQKYSNRFLNKESLLYIYNSGILSKIQNNQFCYYVKGMDNFLKDHSLTTNRKYFNVDKNNQLIFDTKIIKENDIIAEIKVNFSSYESTFKNTTSMTCENIYYIFINDKLPIFSFEWNQSEAYKIIKNHINNLKEVKREIFYISSSLNIESHLKLRIAELKGYLVYNTEDQAKKALKCIKNSLPSIRIANKRQELLQKIDKYYYIDFNDFIKVKSTIINPYCFNSTIIFNNPQEALYYAKELKESLLNKKVKIKKEDLNLYLFNKIS